MKEAKYAVIYPILGKHAKRILGGKGVFCKYVGRGVPSIVTGSKILFYVSHSNFEIVGEGRISKLEFLVPSEILTKYRGKLFLSRKELSEYQRNRPQDRKLLVAVLTGIRKFTTPIISPHPVTMAGETLTQEQYENLTHGNS